MDPVLRVLLGRAGARRASLLGLARVVPPDLWSRRASSGAWTAHEHLAHALSADAVITAVLPRFSETSATALLELRAAALESAMSLPIDDLLNLASSRRDELRRFFATLPSGALQLEGLYDRADQGGARWPVTLGAYLALWAVHDSEHEQAIREAIAVPPDLSAIAHVRRLR